MRFNSVISEFKMYEVAWSELIILPRLVQLLSLGGGTVRRCGDQ